MIYLKYIGTVSDILTFLMLMMLSDLFFSAEAVSESLQTAQREWIRWKKKNALTHVYSINWGGVNYQVRTCMKNMWGQFSSVCLNIANLPCLLLKVDLNKHEELGALKTSTVTGEEQTTQSRHGVTLWPLRVPWQSNKPPVKVTSGKKTTLATAAAL